MRYSWISLVLSVFAGLSGESLLANDIFEYQGGYTRAYGGAGTIMSRSGESLMQNPANLWSSARSDYEVDVGVLSLNYKLTTPDPSIRPGDIKPGPLPLPSFGGSYKSGAYAWGLFFFPTGIGSALKVDDFPAQKAGTYKNIDVEAAQKGFKLGIGTAYRIASDVSLGLSVLYDTQESESKLHLTEDYTIVTKSRARFIRPIVGLRYRMPSLGVLAFSYQFKAQFPYRLEILVPDQEPQEFGRVNYRPTVYSLGFQSRKLGFLRFFGQYAYEVWVPATLVAQPPSQALAADADVEYLNTHNYVLGLRAPFLTAKQIAFSYAVFGKNKGPGLLDDKGEILLNGRGPQDFEALARYHLTLSVESSSKNATWLFYASKIRGTALNPEDSPNSGFYELTIYLAGLSYTGRLR